MSCITVYVLTTLHPFMADVATHVCTPGIDVFNCVAQLLFVIEGGIQQYVVTKAAFIVWLACALLNTISGSLHVNLPGDTVGVNTGNLMSCNTCTVLVLRQLLFGSNAPTVNMPADVICDVAFDTAEFVFTV